MGIMKHIEKPARFFFRPFGRLALLACLAFSLHLFQTAAYGEDTPTPPPVEVNTLDNGYAYYTIPAGSIFHTALHTPIQTSVSQLDDPIEAIITNTIYLDDQVLFEKNTRLYGRILRLEPPIQGRNAIVQVHFNAIKLGGGQIYPVSAHVITEHADHSWGGELTRGTKPYTVVQKVYGIGQYGRTVYGGPRMMGAHLEFLPGSYWSVKLDKPLTIVKSKD